jgi:DNA modification methylase
MEYRIMEVTYIPVNRLKPHPNNARVHSRKQIAQIADSIRKCGYLVPAVIDETGTILSGHGRHAAAKLLGMKEIPTVKAEGLTDTQKRAFLIADNKIAQNAGWDRELLAAELPALAEILIQENLDISITGFSPAEIDQIVLDFEEDKSGPEDEIDPAWNDASPVTKSGDLWLLGEHRLLCGDARNVEDVARLMRSDKAAMAFLDPPYNVKVSGIVGRGKTKHREFAMASGEMSRETFIEFLRNSLATAATVSRPGSVHFCCMDWKHIDQLLEAGREVYDPPLNIIVWTKTNAGQGSFYRSAHEFIVAFRVGGSQHLNNIELGKHGRSRTNVWHYAGANTFRAGRMEDLASHPTAKPVALISDAIKDCTTRRDVVLDTFCGSGSTILAAEKVGRRGYGIEYEPRFVDVGVRRWQSLTGKDAVLETSGVTFDESCDVVRKAAA